MSSWAYDIIEENSRKDSGGGECLHMHCVSDVVSATLLLLPYSVSANCKAGSIKTTSLHSVPQDASVYIAIEYSYSL